MSQLKIFDGVEVRLKSSVEVTHFTIKLQFIIFIRFLLMFRRWIQLNDLIFPLMTILHKTNLRQQKHLSCQGSHIQLCHPQKILKNGGQQEMILLRKDRMTKTMKNLVISKW